MPKSGWKSITLYEDVYDRLFAIYKEREIELRMKGISSFAGFITQELDKIYEKYEDEK